MKKKYIAPDCSYELMEDVGLLSGSVKSDIGIGYGGVDTDGVYEADSRKASLSGWDDMDE